MSTQIGSIKEGTSSPSTTSLSNEEIHSVLSNNRRREVIEQLRSNGDGISVRELSERIAELESGEAPPPRNKRQSAYIALLQTHLPKLDDLGIVEYDSQSKQVQLRDSVGQVTKFMEDAQPHSVSRPELLLGIGVIGLILVLGSDSGLPILGAAPPHYWAYVLLSIVILITGVQTYHHRRSEGVNR